MKRSPARKSRLRSLLFFAVFAAYASAAHAKTIYVDQAGGSDANGGLSPDDAVATLTRGVELLSGGDVMIVGPGVYYEALSLDGLGSSDASPVWIRAEPYGGAVVSGMWPGAALGTAAWQDEGDGVYSAEHGPVLFGSFEGTFLYRFASVADLRARSASSVAVAMPPYGLAVEGGRVYLRLPGNLDPNGRSVLLSPPSWGEDGTQTVVRVSGSPNVIFDGLRIEGSGTYCLSFSQDSTAPTVRNTVFAFCRYALLLPSASLVEWSEYTYPGFHDFVTELQALNGGEVGSIYEIVKNYHPSAWLEGGLADTYGSSGVTSTDCEFRYNFYHETFDGESLGDFEYSESHHNVYLYNYDNHVEMESWAGFGSRELRLHDSLFLSCPSGPISHQEESITGPQYVYRNVVVGYDDNGWGTWTIIKSRAPNADEGIFYYHNLLWSGDSELFWDEERRDMLHFRNNIFIFTRNRNSESGAFDSDYNLLVNDTDKPWLYGAAGAYLGSDPAALDFVDVEGLDFGINPGSPAENAGVDLPGFNDGAPGGPDIGPFEAGASPGPGWPRPMGTAFTCTVPERWTGEAPPLNCEVPDEDDLIVIPDTAEPVPDVGDLAPDGEDVVVIPDGEPSEPTAEGPSDGDGNGCGCRIVV